MERVFGAYANAETSFSGAAAFTLAPDLDEAGSFVTLFHAQLDMHTWEQQTVTLEPDDTLVSVSDGVLDLFDGTLAGLDEVGNLVRSTDNAQSVVDHRLARAGRLAPDDVTVVVVRRAGQPPARHPWRIVALDRLREASARRR